MAVNRSRRAGLRPMARRSCQHPGTRQSSCGASLTASASGLSPDIGEPANLCSSSVGKTVKVTVLPTPTPRSPGERRRRPLQMCSLTLQKWQRCGPSVQVFAQRRPHRVGILGQDPQDLGRGIGQVPDDAGRPQVPLFVLCHCVGKT